jgi:phage-related protein
MTATPRKPLGWLVATLSTPPLGPKARHEAGALLRLLQEGEMLSLPYSRPMPAIGPRVHELRVNDAPKAWRIFYRIDPDDVLVIEWVLKKTQETPMSVIRTCKARLRHYDQTKGMGGGE